MNPILALQADLSTVKQHLKMAYVLEAYGHQPELQDTDGKLHYFSPFREEDHPSFDVFSHIIKGRTEPEERYGDFADPNLNQGDVVDLVMLLESCSHVLAMDKARDLLAAQLESNWAGPTVERGQYHTLDLSEVEYYRSQKRSLTASLTWLGLPRTHPGLTDVVLPSDRVFLHPALDIIVFLLLDDDGEVRGVRHRNEEGQKYGLLGGRNILMRLEPPSQKPAFLTEGETDTWAAWGALHEDYEVLGVPGVGTTPQLAGADSLAGRIVYISFDPDAAGDSGRSVWADYLTSIGCDVRTIVLPDGKDIAELNPEVIARLPERARTLPPAPESFARNGDRFGSLAWVGKGDDRELVFHAKSNWSFVPKKILIAHDGKRAYQGELRPSGKTVILPDGALTSSAQLKSWGAKYQARWFGSDPMVQQLASLLDHEAAYLPEGRIHNQVGLYEGSFVWPGGYIGEQPVEYEPTTADANMGPDKIFVKQAKVNPVAVFRALYAAQHPAVTGPILAWLAAAPLRTRFDQSSGSAQFPFLSVTGVSGSGKSALTEMFLRVFSSVNLSLTLSSTTPHAVTTMMDNSCGFPVWFDEYRPGARAETLTALDQLLREAYTMQTASKGGQDRSNLSKLTDIRTASPIVVSGEDNFTEESHVERLVAVRLVHSEQGDLGALQHLRHEGFAHAYLSFLTMRPNSAIDDVTPPVFESPGLWEPSGFDVKDRPERNLRVLQYGWYMLSLFLESYDPMFAMPDLDLTRVVAQYTESAKSNPVVDLISLCLEIDTQNPTVWKHQGYVAVHPQALIDESLKHPSIILPVKTADGIRKLLQDKYGCGETILTDAPVAFGARRRVRALRIPLDALGFTHEQEEIHHDNHPEI